MIKAAALHAKFEVIAGAIYASAAASTSAIVASTFAVHPLHAAAAVLGGISGALVTAKAAFNPGANKTVSYIAVSVATSLFVGATAGFFVPLAFAEIFRMQIDIASPTLWGVTWIVGFGGERIANVAVDRLSLTGKGEDKK